MREEMGWRTAALIHRVCPEQQKGGNLTVVHELLVMAMIGRVVGFPGWQEKIISLRFQAFSDSFITPHPLLLRG